MCSAKYNDYDTRLQKKSKDVMTVQEVVALTGYSKAAVNNWCANGNPTDTLRR